MASKEHDFSVGSIPSNIISLALPMTEDELLSGHILEKFRRLYLKKDLPVRESAWYEGSAKLYSSRAAWHQRHYRRYKELIYLRKGLERKLRK